MSHTSPVSRIATVAAAGTIVALLGTPAAIAAPVANHSPHSGGVFVVMCPFGDVSIVSPPNEADFTPGFDVDSHRLAIPYRFTFTATDASGTVVFDEALAKKAPLPPDAVTCTFGNQFTDESGQVLTFQATVVLVVRGKP